MASRYDNTIKALGRIGSITAEAVGDALELPFNGFKAAHYSYRRRAWAMYEAQEESIMLVLGRPTYNALDVRKVK